MVVFQLVVAVYGDYFVCGCIDGGVVEFLLLLVMLFLLGEGVLVSVKISFSLFIQPPQY